MKIQPQNFPSRRSHSRALVAITLAFCSYASGAPADSALNVLVSFNGKNGAEPTEALVQGTDGNFYGTTAFGGDNDFGTVFKVTASGALTSLFSFNGTNGAYPSSTLTWSTTACLYGTTFRGGGTFKGDEYSSFGTLFKITADGRLTTLYSFLNGEDGALPGSGLAQDSQGNLYGTTSFGTTNDFGTVFKATTNGHLITLVSFNGGNGAEPVGRLLWNSDEHFYGATSSGSPVFFIGGPNYGRGTVFKISVDGVLATLDSFNGTNGAWPNARLVKGSDGNFYGTTRFGGSDYFGFAVSGKGTVFKIAPNGNLVTLVQFEGWNGANPTGGLVLGDNGNFYGMTPDGGNGHKGTIFKMSSNGVLTNLVSFHGSNGASPEGELVRGSDRNFYGMTRRGGKHDKGVIFRFKPHP